MQDFTNWIANQFAGVATGMIATLLLGVLR